MRASILIPTRGRRDYLAVALASVAPQAAARGAELIVVEDGAADPATAALVERAGGRYIALGAPRGLNVARNAAIDAASGELLCFLDDDVEAWPAWLGALLDGAAAAPSADVLGGPIRARLEGADLRACGREPGPITELDLGAADRDAEVVWGANMAVRATAFTRFGRFDPALSGAGDEETWERALAAAGGRVRYLARAGVDHRRAGADARVPALARAAYHRGRQARRLDERDGAAPRLARELRVLAGCVWHIARRRCGNGVVMTARTAGRLREALAASATADGGRDYLSGASGALGRRALAVAAARDAAADLWLRAARPRVARLAAAQPPRRVLVVMLERPQHAATAAAARRELARSRHALRMWASAPAPGAGKWASLNAALASSPVGDADWLLVIDDDVVLPSEFLDRFLALAERHGLVLAQPAHAYRSHAAWRVTRRRPGALARRTRFVEIGPVTAIHRAAFPALLPFPDLQMGWGLDVHWSAVAQQRGWSIGVVDATPVRHIRPVAVDYPRDAAVSEADAFLAGRPYVTRAEAERTLETWR